MFTEEPKGATAHTEPESKGFSGLLWMLFGAIVTLMVGVFVYKSPIFGFNNPQPQVEQTDEPTIKTKVPLDKDNPDYQFYDLLPDQKSQVIPETIVEPKVIEEKIEKKAKHLKADVVVKESNQPTDNTATEQPLTTDQNNPQSDIEISQESLTQTVNNTEKSTENSTTDSVPVADEGEMIIVYENSTYDGDDDNNGKNNTSSTSKATSSNEESKKEPIKALSITETHTEKTVTNNAKNSIKSTASTVQNAKENGTAIIKKATKEEKKAKPSKSYLLQIDTYDNADDADTRRAQVLLAGVDAQVIKKQVNEQIFYQVVSTQMSSPESVVRAQQNLQKNGIGSIVVEKRVQ